MRIQIGANGNIGVAGNYSYEDFDRTAAGNVADMTVWQGCRALEPALSI